MIPASYHDFFSGCATVAGALIGLLFVAISVSPEKLTGDTASIDHQVKAAAAFSALVNALVIALVALLPRVNLGDAGIVLAYAGLISTISLIILQYREHKRRIEPGQALMFVMLFVLYGLQLANSMQLERSPRDLSRVTNEGVLSIFFFMFAIIRAWQLVGARNTSLLSAVAGLAQRPAGDGTQLPAGEQAGHPAQADQAASLGLPE